MKKYFKVAFGSFLALSIFYFSLVGHFYFVLPNEINSTETEEISFGRYELVSAHKTEAELQTAFGQNESQRLKLKILGVFPVKEITVNKAETKKVILSGDPFGIKFLTDGVTVISLSNLQTKDGELCPAKKAGLSVGDCLVSINGKTVATNENIREAVENSGGKALTVVYKRGGDTFETELTPLLCSDGMLRVGMWIKDSAAGIGTMTFIDPETMSFGGLGHPICDTSSGNILSVGKGEITSAQIFDVSKGVSGIPGELKGSLKGGDTGDLLKNTETGVFGKIYSLPKGEEIEIGYKQSISPGKAEIITTLPSGKGRFEVEIEKISLNSSQLTKNMVIKITDPDLLSETGGIVQGMSGSPIIQNGKLVGAVTHVLVDDPTKGYAIFAENMLETAQNVSEQQLKEAS